MNLRPLLCILGWLLVMGLGRHCAAAEEWQAGVAKASILPEKPMWMSGYASRDHVAEGTQTELYAKTLVLMDPAGQRVAIVTLDLVGVDRNTAEAMRTGIASLGIPFEQSVICCSHTHSGPVVGQNLTSMYGTLAAEQKQLVGEYTATLVQKVIDTVKLAIADLRPATLSHASGQATFAVNRRNNPEAEVPQLREKGELRGPSDHDVPVLAVKSDNKLRAVLFGYACHSTVLSGYFWNADYPGYAQTSLEEAHPEAVALFWAGCGADQNPLPRRTVELAQEYGTHLAKAVETVLAAPMAPITGNLAAAYGLPELGFANVPTQEQLEVNAKSENLYEAGRAKFLLQHLATTGTLLSSYNYPVQTWRLGDGPTWVTLGGEVVVDYALRIKQELGGPVWVAGYSNDVMAYIPSLRVLKEGGYEGASSMVYYGLPSAWNEQVEETILQEVHRQVKATEHPEKNP